MALYIFSQDKASVEYILDRFQSGGAAVNSVMLQFGNHDLPFGGLGESGNGRYHGFLELSHQRAVIEQSFLSFIRKLTLPPYTDFKNRYIRWLRYF